MVAADFLEENDEADRAVFIRVQCALAQLEACGLSKSLEADELRKKERAFLGPLALFQHFWAAEECPELVRVKPPPRGGSPLAHMQVEGAEQLVWRRGFVERVRCPASKWLQHGIAVRKRQPVIAVELSDCDRHERDAWYRALDTLRGLNSVTLTGTTPEFGEWLALWLTGTAVTVG